MGPAFSPAESRPIGPGALPLAGMVRAVGPVKFGGMHPDHAGHADIAQAEQDTQRSTPSEQDLRPKGPPHASRAIGPGHASNHAIRVESPPVGAVIIVLASWLTSIVFDGKPCPVCAKD